MSLRTWQAQWVNSFLENANDFDPAARALVEPATTWNAEERDLLVSLVDHISKPSPDNCRFEDLFGTPIANIGSRGEKDRSNLLEQLRNESNEFPRNNLVYQAVVWFFRAQPKTDHHCHLSVGQHWSTVARFISSMASHQRELAAKAAFRLKGVSPVVASTLGERIAVDAPDLAGIERYLAVGPTLRNWENGDFWIVSMEALTEAVRATATTFLLDNVVNFGMRLNPFKNLESMKAAAPDGRFIEVVERVLDSMDQATRAARQTGVHAGRTGIGLSLNRRKQGDNISLLLGVLPTLRLLPKQLVERIHFIDPSGPEYASDETDKSPGDWEKVVTGVDGLNIGFCPHLGDIRNIDLTLQRDWVDYLSTRGNSRCNSHQAVADVKLTRVISHHLKYCQMWLNLLPPGSGLAHGIILAHENVPLLIPPDLAKLKESRQVDWTNLGQVDADLVDLAAGLVDTAREKGFYVAACPTTTVKSLRIGDFRRMPIFQFRRDGLKVRIGVDGTWDPPEPRTLSEEMARLFLVRPLIGNALSVQEILDLASPL
jgi:hypothetical protein